MDISTMALWERGLSTDSVSSYLGLSLEVLLQVFANHVRAKIAQAVIEHQVPVVAYGAVGFL